MNVGTYDLDNYVDQTVTVTGVFTWNMMRWAIFPTSIEDGVNTGITTIASDKATLGDVFTITGINLGNADMNTLPAGIYIQGGKKFIKR
jgi:hypothetical protein